MKRFFKTITAVVIATLACTTLTGCKLPIDLFNDPFVGHLFNPDKKD